MQVKTPYPTILVVVPYHMTTNHDMTDAMHVTANVHVLLHECAYSHVLAAPHAIRHTDAFHKLLCICNCSGIGLMQHTHHTRPATLLIYLVAQKDKREVLLVSRVGLRVTNMFDSKCIPSTVQKMS